MSRTKKDMPFWVRAEWYEPFHTCGWYKVRKYVETDVPCYWDKSRFEKKFVGYTWEYRGDCDLPAEPVVENTSAWRRRYSPRRCVWEAEWPRERHFNTRGTRKTENVHYEFHGPLRAATRDACRKAVQGEVEIDFPDGRARSSVKWDMW